MIVHRREPIPRFYRQAYATYVTAPDPGLAAKGWKVYVRVCFPWGLHWLIRTWLALKMVLPAVREFWREMGSWNECDCVRCRSDWTPGKPAALVLDVRCASECGGMVHVRGVHYGDDDPAVAESLERGGWRRIDGRWYCARCMGTSGQLGASWRKPREESND